MESPSKSATNPIPIKIGKKNSPNRKAGQEDKDEQTVKEIAKSFAKDDEFLRSFNKEFFPKFAKKLMDNGKFASIVQGACNEGETALERLMNAYDRAMNLYQRILDAFLMIWRQKSKDDQKKIEQISKIKVCKKWEMLNKWNELKKHLLDHKGIFGSPPKRDKQQKKPNQTIWEFNKEVKEQIKIDLMALIRTKSKANCMCQPCEEMKQLARNFSERDANGEGLSAKAFKISSQNSRVIPLEIKEKKGNEKQTDGES
ncbi:hypothetical protein niasHT_024285 [Heterodera trifolii]|uniref:Uncharacterized protein n=1 Tax=Heterodera trifolii TaxID=157864 RepID=A0ABD2JMQ1_9BILA